MYTSDKSVDRLTGLSMYPQFLLDQHPQGSKKHQVIVSRKAREDLRKKKACAYPSAGFLRYLKFICNNYIP